MTIRQVLSGDRTWHIETIDVLAGLRSLPDGCVQCVVTSPPYWGLRDYGVDGQIGLEKTPEEFVAKMVEVFREVRRVLRDDGTLWLNIGDSYCGSWGNAGSRPELDGQTQNQREKSVAYLPRGGWDERRDRPPASYRLKGIKPKDMIGVPWMLAFALRQDGWWLRSEIIWHKRSPMPESVSDRPTKSHEQIFLLTKSARYFYDHVAGSEKTTGGTHSRGKRMKPPKEAENAAVGNGHVGWCESTPHLVSRRNMRSVWSLSTEPFKGAHFATFPTKLVRKCLLAGTSEHGCCPACGAPWRRVVQKRRVKTRPGTASKIRIPHGWATGSNSHATLNHQTERGREVIGNRDPERHVTESVTTGWQPSCECAAAEPIPCIVMDPFSGAGTTVMVARRMGLRGIGFELSSAYAEMSRRRIVEDAPLMNTQRSN